jgi:peptidoglycan/LPS O-acetylase OafA/YrhL
MVSELIPATPIAGSPGRARSIADGISGHRNSFGIIRLTLATAVIFSHAFYLGGWGEDPLLSLDGRQESIGGLAVLGFFAISGYLITKSGMTADAMQFIWRRMLRILPAFWLVLIVGAFVIGPIVWVLSGNPLATYVSLQPAGPIRYVLVNADLMMRQWGIYDIFASNPYGPMGGATMNGSLWTLTYEWGSYLIIWLLVLVGLMSKARIVIPALTAFYFGLEVARVILPGSPGLIFPYFADHYRVTLPLIFLFGACIAVYARRIPLDGRLAVLSAVIVVLTLWKGGLTLFGYPAIAYLVIWLAAVLPQRLQWIGAKNDYSYGMYLYGFLVQQFTAFFGWYKWGYALWVAATIVVTAGFAWLSWHLLEKNAMKLKDWGPGRGISHWREWLRGRREARRLERSERADDAEPSSVD